ncbi:MAG: polysaccharide deacetylase [Sphingomonadaceae bacterium]
MTRLTVNLSFHIDGMSSWISTMKTNNPAALSRGEFAQIATPRILDLLKRHGLQASFAVPGHTAYAFPNLMARIRDEGHECLHHGWIHENPANYDEAGERLNLERGCEAIFHTTGIQPVGYASPANDFSKVTLKILKEFGFLYDASYFGDDYNAYYPRVDDEWSMDTPYKFGTPIDIVELPWSWHLDDIPAFEFILGMNTGLMLPSQVEEVWKAEFDFAYKNSPGGIFTLLMHPEVIARGARINLLDRFIQYAKDHEGVKFDSLVNYARGWKQENPFDQWCRENPERLGVGSIQEFPARAGAGAWQR